MREKFRDRTLRLEIRGPGKEGGKPIMRKRSWVSLIWAPGDRRRDPRVGEALSPCGAERERLKVTRDGGRGDR